MRKKNDRYEVIFQKKDDGMDTVHMPCSHTSAYDNKWWRIQLWKGRYGATNGGEMGVYTSNKKAGWYRCTGPSEMLKMNISLKNKAGKTLFTRTSGKQTHWWLNGFKTGKKISKNNLTLSGSITFKSVTMAKRFKEAYYIRM